jgi:hypothetical protein
MKQNIWIYIVVIVFVLGVAFILTLDGPRPPVGGDSDEHGCIISAGYVWNESDQRCVREFEKTYCQPRQRDTSACYALYKPVCGYFQVECIRAPCPLQPQTFSNDCVACSNKRVQYYTEGECK